MKFGTHDLPESTTGLMPPLITQRWLAQADGMGISVFTGKAAFGATYEAWVMPRTGWHLTFHEDFRDFTEPERFDTPDEVGAYIDAAMSCLTKN